MNSHISPIRFGGQFHYPLSNISPIKARDAVKAVLTQVIDATNNSDSGRAGVFYGKMDGDTLEMVCLDQYDHSVSTTFHGLIHQTAVKTDKDSSISNFPTPIPNISVPDEQALAKIKKSRMDA